MLPAKSAFLVVFLALSACKSTTRTTFDGDLKPWTAEETRAKLQKFSKKKVQLWVVAHVRAHKVLKPDGSVDEETLTQGILEDVDAIVHGGADAVLLINSRAEFSVYEPIIARVRERYPDFPLGISALSYGPSNLIDGFALAKKYDAQIVWTEVVPGEKVEYEDDDESWKEAELISPELALSTHRSKADVFHASGVHMKYTKPLDGRSFPDAVKASLGLVDGLNVTGPETGVLADVERIKTARSASGAFPIGLASGVSIENIESVIGEIDYAIVGTSLKEDDDPLRVSRQKVKELRALMDVLSE